MRPGHSITIISCLALLLVAASFSEAQAQTYRSAVVVSIDRPENCLRVRSGPGTSYPIVGCVRMGERLQLTGAWSQNNWAEIDLPAKGWVTGSQIRRSATVYVPGVVVPAPAVTYVEPSPVVRTYVRTPYYPYRRYGYGVYGGPGVGVRVGPGGGVAVRAGGVAVGVGPRGGWGVRIR
ncbi:MAG: SH3 domain-containing protein [Desulfomonile tiedjei]|nr:SH3 domain-containing protein [Desulfomonile tiedjei]